LILKFLKLTYVYTILKLISLLLLFYFQKRRKTKKTTKITMDFQMPAAPKGFYNPPGTKIFVPFPPGKENENEGNFHTPAPPTGNSKKGKSCLITTGATAPFPSLVFAALSTEFTRALQEHGFTSLQIQAGPTTADPKFQAAVSSSPSSTIKIEIFAFSENLGEEMMAHSDLVVSHAGAGSVLEALRWGKKLVVVENENLMAGHQREIVDELGEQGLGYLVGSDVKGLVDAVCRVLGGRVGVVVCETQFPQSGSKKFLEEVLNEEMGFMKEG
jgi:beta-1,4-N-acetylglucosaminyltransferase